MTDVIGKLRGVRRQFQPGDQGRSELLPDLSALNYRRRNVTDVQREVT